MAAKTVKNAIRQGFEKHESTLTTNVLKLREDILMEIKDACAHEFMIVSSQLQNSLKDPKDAELAEFAFLGLFDRLFPSSIIRNKERRDEHKKRN